MECKTGFYHVVPFGACLPCPDFCPTCTSPNNCVSCAPGFYLNKGMCEPCSTPNCQSCSASSVQNKCSLCFQGYYLNIQGNACLKCPSNCTICSINNSGLLACSTCTQGYFMGKNSCTACPNNCLTCQSSSSCATCVAGFYLTPLLNCAACPQGCASCNAAATCSACDVGFYWDVNSDTKEGSCLRCKSPCHDCRDSPTNCLMCTAGYQLSAPGTCTPCSQGCLGCDPSYGCLLCGSGFIKVVNNNEPVCVACP